MRPTTISSSWKISTRLPPGNGRTSSGLPGPCAEGGSRAPPALWQLPAADYHTGAPIAASRAVLPPQHTEAAGILTHRSDRRDQSGGYGEASRRLRADASRGRLPARLPATWNAHNPSLDKDQSRRLPWERTTDRRRKCPTAIQRRVREARPAASCSPTCAATRPSPSARATRRRASC